MKMVVYWTRVVNLVEKSCPLLHKEFQKMGYDDHTMEFHWQTVHTHVNELFADMLDEARRKIQETGDVVRSLMKEITEISKELHTKEDLSQYSSISSLQIVKEQLQHHLKALKTLKEERICRLQKLQEKENEVCSKLGISPSIISKAVPTDSELDEFQSLVEKHEMEKDRLEQEFQESVTAILQMMSDLEISPSLEFERQVCEHPENFTYSPANMTRLRDLLNQLTNRIDDAKREAETKKAELRALWKYLGESAETCEAFLAEHPGFRLGALNAIKAEIKRCKIKRSENIANYVDKLRQEIVQLWEMCKIAEEEREQFTAFFCQIFNEDLLALHELEVQKLRNFYSENSSIFELLEERNCLWKKMMELETRENDKDRLHNRGGQLLAEEKERKKICKKLPKTEEQLKALVENYEQERGYSFKINGVTLDEFLRQSWDELDQKRELLKKARKEAKDKAVLKKTPVSASKKAGVSFRSMRKLTPASAGTSRRLFLETTPEGRRGNVTNEKRTPNSTRLSSSKKTRKGTLLVNRVGFHRAAEVSQKSRRSRSMPRTVNISESSYGEFQKHLENRQELRSSVLPSQLLKKFHSGSRTTGRPVKPIRKNVGSSTGTSTNTISSSCSSSTAISPRRVAMPNLRSKSPHGTPRSSRIPANPRLLPVRDGSIEV